MKKTAFFCNSPANIQRVYANGRQERIAALTELYPTIITAQNFDDHATALHEIEAVFSTWGMFEPSASQWDALPALKAVFYGAGSVKNFAPAFLDRDIMVVSAWAANAVPVAEFSLAQILLATKCYWRNTEACNSPATRADAYAGPGNFGETVALLGAGMIGRGLIELLKPFRLNVIVWDPFLSAEAAEALGVEKVETLQETFERGLVVSNHLANVPETRALLDRPLFKSMRERGTFINTGRGATVIESDLADVLKARPDLTALLDVTFPEPPGKDSQFYKLSNVHLTSHIAGSLGDELIRMADYVIEEFEAWHDGNPLRYKVTPDMLATMA